MIPIPGKLYAYGAIIVGVALVFAVQKVQIHRAKADAVEARQALLDYQAAAARAIVDRIQENQRLELKQAQRTKEVTRTYENRLADLRARYAERLRNFPPSGSSGSPVPGDPGTSGGTDGAPVDDPATRFLGELRACEEDRERLRALQDWARTLRAQ